MSEELIKKLRGIAISKENTDFAYGRKAPLYGKEAEIEWEVANRIEAYTNLISDLVKVLNEEMDWIVQLPIPTPGASGRLLKLVSALDSYHCAFPPTVYPHKDRLMVGFAVPNSSTLIEEQAARIAGLEDVLEEKRENINSLRARLSEAVKVLERLAEGEMSDTGHTSLREAAKDFIATLGGEK